MIYIEQTHTWTGMCEWVPGRNTGAPAVPFTCPLRHAVVTEHPRKMSAPSFNHSAATPPVSAGCTVNLNMLPLISPPACRARSRSRDLEWSLRQPGGWWRVAGFGLRSGRGTTNLVCTRPPERIGHGLGEIHRELRIGNQTRWTGRGWVGGGLLHWEYLWSLLLSTQFNMAASAS